MAAADRVLAISGKDVWVTGTEGGPATTTAFAERWDGTSWTLEQVPQGVDNMTVFSGRNMWGVGFGSSGTLTAHWDGSSWTEVPNPGQWGAYDAAVVPGTGQVWAVGAGFSSSRFRTFTMRYC